MYENQKDKMKISRVLTQLKTNSASSDEDFKRFLKSLDFTVDQDFLELYSVSNGASGFISPSAFILFWSIEEILDLNPYYEDNEFCKDALFFGSDGASTGYGILKTSLEYFRVDYLDIPEGCEFHGKKLGDFLDYIS